jgi:hypothetical protein
MAGLFFKEGPHPAGHRSVYYLALPEVTEDKEDLARAFIDSLAFQRILLRLQSLGPCLCCHFVSKASEAEKITEELKQVLRYVRYETLENTRVLERYQELKHSRLQHPQNLTGPHKRTAYPEAVKAALCGCRAAEQEFGYCVRSGRLWFSRHAGLPKYLRHLSKKLKAQGCALQLLRPTSRDLASLPYSTPIQMVQAHGPDASKKMWGALAQSAPA